MKEDNIQIVDMKEHTHDLEQFMESLTVRSIILSPDIYKKLEQVAKASKVKDKTPEGFIKWFVNDFHAYMIKEGKIKEE